MIDRVKLSSGHLTTGADAEEILDRVRVFFERLIKGDVPVKESFDRRGAMHDFWLEDASRFSVVAPRRLVEDARRHFESLG